MSLLPCSLRLSTLDLSVKIHHLGQYSLWYVLYCDHSIANVIIMEELLHTTLG